MEKTEVRKDGCTSLIYELIHRSGHHSAKPDALSRWVDHKRGKGDNQNQILLSPKLFHINATLRRPTTGAQIIPREGNMFLEWIQNCINRDEKVVKALKKLGTSRNLWGVVRGKWTYPVSQQGVCSSWLNTTILLENIIFLFCLFKRNNNSLFVFIPNASGAFWWCKQALRCWISTESRGKIIWRCGWRGCIGWCKWNEPIVSGRFWGVWWRGCCLM